MSWLRSEGRTCCKRFEQTAANTKEWAKYEKHETRPNKWRRFQWMLLIVYGLKFLLKCEVIEFFFFFFFAIQGFKAQVTMQKWKKTDI
jgi:hypothetical protein